MKNKPRMLWATKDRCGLGVFIWLYKDDAHLKDDRAWCATGERLWLCALSINEFEDMYGPLDYGKGKHIYAGAVE